MSPVPLIFWRRFERQRSCGPANKRSRKVYTQFCDASLFVTAASCHSPLPRGPLPPSRHRPMSSLLSNILYQGIRDIEATRYAHRKYSKTSGALTKYTQILAVASSSIIVFDHRKCSSKKERCVLMRCGFAVKSLLWAQKWVFVTSCSVFQLTVCKVDLIWVRNNRDMTPAPLLNLSIWFREAHGHLGKLYLSLWVFDGKKFRVKHAEMHLGQNRYYTLFSVVWVDDISCYTLYL